MQSSYMGDAGQALNIEVTAGSGDRCHWENVDDFYWNGPGGSR
jgi:hypothetical protein